MSNFKTDIKKAITGNTRFIAQKVQCAKTETHLDGQITMWIEVTVRKKTKP